MKSKANKINGMIIISVIVALSLVGLIVVLLTMLHNRHIGSFMIGPAISEYQNYLENKYGKDEGFSYTGNEGKGGCPIIDAGFCEKTFTSKKTGKEFLVYYSTNNSSEASAQSYEQRESLRFSDRYYLALYGDDLEKYYDEKYGRFFENSVPYKSSISIDAHYPLFGLDEKPTSFDQVISKIESNEYYSKFLDVNINVDYKEIGLNNIEKIDLESIKSKVKTILEENAIVVTEVSLLINMAGSGLTGLCPGEFSTVRPHSLNVNTDEEITACSETLYSMPYMLRR